MMQTQAVSSINLYKIFRDRFSDEEAEIIVSSLSDVYREGLATKEDIVGLDNRITAVRDELKEEIASVRTEVASVRTELKGDIAELRTEVASVRTELKGDIARLEITLIKWFIGTAITLVGLVVAALRLLG